MIKALVDKGTIKVSPKWDHEIPFDKLLDQCNTVYVDTQYRERFENTYNGKSILLHDKDGTYTELALGECGWQYVSDVKVDVTEERYVEYTAPEAVFRVEYNALIANASMALFDHCDNQITPNELNVVYKETFCTLTMPKVDDSFSFHATLEKCKREVNAVMRSYKDVELTDPLGIKVMKVKIDLFGSNLQFTPEE